MDCSDKTVLRLSGALKAELTSLVVLGTLGTSVRGLQVLSALLAPATLLTPATRSWPQLEPAYLEKWCRKLPGTRSERACWTKLLAPSRAFLRMHGLLDAEEETPEAGHRSHPLWEVSARGLEYHETWRRPIRRPKHTSSTAQGGGGSFKNRKPIGEIGCCESGMAERSH